MPSRLAIIGGGPAALTAALYSARAGVDTTVYVGDKVGGALVEIEHIANYPGFEGSGSDLALNMERQAKSAGAKIEYGACEKLEKSASGFTIKIDGEELTFDKVLVATGSEPKTLPFELETPVSYCGLCDGALTKGKDIVVVGGGNSAIQEAVYLSGIAKSVTVVSHSPFRAAKCLLDAAREVKNLTLERPLEPTPEYLEKFDHVFVFIGKRPATRFLPASVLDESGFIITGAAIPATAPAADRAPHETSIPGLYAAGDVRTGTLHQVVTAAADGAAAATEISA